MMNGSLWNYKRKETERWLTGMAVYPIPHAFSTSSYRCGAVIFVETLRELTSNRMQLK